MLACHTSAADTFQAKSNTRLLSVLQVQVQVVESEAVTDSHILAYGMFYRN